MNEITPVLSVVERKELATLETSISNGIKNVGEALKRIHDSRLYREEFQSFEAYCTQKWQFSKTYAYGQIAICDTRKTSPFINESTPHSHVAELAKLESDARPVVYAAAQEVANAENRKVTAKDIRQIAAPKSTVDSTVDSPTAKTRAITAINILADRIAHMYAECPNENLWAEANDQIRFLTQIVTDWE